MGSGIIGNIGHQACQFRGGLGHSGTVDWMSDGFGRGGATLCRPALLRPCLELVLVANYQHCWTLSLCQDCRPGANQGIKTPSFTARSCALTRLSSLSLFGSVPIRVCHRLALDSRYRRARNHSHLRSRGESHGSDWL